MRKTTLFLLILAVLLTACQPDRTPEAEQPIVQEAPAQTIEEANNAEIAPATPPVDWEFHGASMAGYWHDSYAQPNAYDLVDYMKSSGVNTVAVIVSWFQDDMTANEIYPMYETESPTDESVAALIDYIHSQDMDVMLKPHLEPRRAWEGDYPGWRGVIQPSDPEIWFTSYETFITHYVEMAADHDVALFAIGTEMASSTLGVENQARWLAMAENIRKIYSGKLIYAAHEYEVFGGIYGLPNEETLKFKRLPASFWEPFDYAATTVYYDIGSPANPATDTETLFKSWYENPERPEEMRKLVAAFEEWQAQHNKPVIFAEIGYRSIDYAAYHPYNTFGANGKDLSEDYNEDAQANAYEAAFQVWGDTDWLSGAFWWQISPLDAANRECGSDVTYTLGDEITYTPCGKAADEILYHWYNSNAGTPTIPPAYVPDLPDLLTLHNIDDTFLQRAWRVQSSGKIEFSLDPSVQFGNNTQSLHLVSNLPCTDPRYGQLDYTFTTPQDFSTYNSLSFSVRAANPEDHGEISIILLDKDGVEWQSTNWLAGDEWQEFRIALRPGADTPANPWTHPVDFVVPSWFKFYDERDMPESFNLDLSNITGIRLKAVTVDSECEANPTLEVWFGDLHLSEEELAYEPQPVELPIIDNFNTYEDRTALVMSGNWEGYTSGVLAIDVVSNNATRNQPALQLLSFLPCDNERYAGVSRRFLEPIDLSKYSLLTLRARGDGVNEAPYGGELTITLKDAHGETEELWQSSRWLPRAEGWSDIQIMLQGNSVDDNWHENDFAIPSWGQTENTQLDLNSIVEIGVRIGTTEKDDQGNLNCEIHPHFAVWVDDIAVK